MKKMLMVAIIGMVLSGCASRYNEAQFKTIQYTKISGVVGVVGKDGKLHPLR